MLTVQILSNFISTSCVWLFLDTLTIMSRKSKHLKKKIKSSSTRKNNTFVIIILIPSLHLQSISWFTIRYFTLLDRFWRVFFPTIGIFRKFTDKNEGTLARNLQCMCKCTVHSGALKRPFYQVLYPAELINTFMCKWTIAILHFFVYEGQKYVVKIASNSAIL